jgi:hypothetical protein
MLLPNVLRENIAQLKMSIYGISEKYQNPKNAQVIIPVWCWYKDTADLNPNIRYYNGGWGTTTLFAAAAGTDPQVIDCCVSGGGAVVDVNNSTLVADIIEDWNAKISGLQQFSLPTSPAGISAGNGNLLYMTRVVRNEAVVFDRRPSSYLKEKMFNNTELVKKVIERKDSKKGMKPEIIEEYLPSGSGLANEFVDCYTSIGEITGTVKQLLPYIILPIIPIDTTPYPPTAVQWRTLGLEAKCCDVSSTNRSTQNTRLAQIIVSADKMAPGEAANMGDEFSNVINFMNGLNKGGFFGDLLGGLIEKGAGMLKEMIPL